MSTTITILIMGLACSFFISGTSLSDDMLCSVQAQRNAQIAVMHLDKYARNAASEFTVASGTSVVDPTRTVSYLEYNVYDSPPDIINGPAITSRYEYYDNNLIYIPDTAGAEVVLVSKYINDCEFTFTARTADNIVLEVEIEALDNNYDPESVCAVSTMVSAAATVS